MKNFLRISIVTLLITACDGPLDKQYSEATFGEDLKEMKENGVVDSTDLQYIGLYAVRAEMLGEDLEGKTYEEILDNAKTLREKAEAQEAEEKALADKVAREEMERREALSKVLTVAMFDKGYAEYDYQDYLTYGIAYENKSDRDIRAIKGSIQINDLFDTEIKTINVTEDDGIPAGETLKMTYTTDYNQFRDEDTRLRNKELENLKIVWTPEKIIFTDGTTLE